jgi:hypothetical protein
MTILELGRTVALRQYAVPLDRFVRKVVLGPFDVDPALLATFPGLDESARPIISITGLTDGAGAFFSPQSSIEDVVTQQQSFYFDFDEQTLYYHIPPSESPFDFVILYGLSQGFSDDAVVYIDNLQHLPVITSAPALRQQQDIENYDRLAFITGAVTISNTSGRLDDLIDSPIYGNDVNLYYLPGGKTNYTRDELTQIASLFVEDYDISPQALSLRVQDRRKSQNISVPTVRFEQDDYPQGNAEIWGLPVPVVWGTPREIPGIVTNFDTTSGNVKIRAGLTMTSLGTVQAFVNNDWVTVTPLNVNLATGEFEVSEAQGRSSGVAHVFRLVNATGISITRITDIIKDANERFLGVDYNDSNYNTEEWEAEETEISTGAYYLDTEVELFEVFRDLQNGANIGFRYEVEADGRRTIRIDNEAREPVATIDKIFIRNRDSLRISTDSTNLLAEVVIKYGLSYQSGRWIRYFDDGSAESVVDLYRQRPRREYETLLLNEALAQEKAEYLRSRFDTIRGIIDVDLMRDTFINLRIYDIINIELSPDDDRVFYGTWKAKVLSIAPDTRNGTNRITAVLIEKI